MLWDKQYSIIIFIFYSLKYIYHVFTSFSVFYYNIWGNMYDHGELFFWNKYPLFSCHWWLLENFPMNLFINHFVYSHIPSHVTHARHTHTCDTYMHVNSAVVCVEPPGLSCVPFSLLRGSLECVFGWECTLITPATRGPGGLFLPRFISMFSILLLVLEKSSLFLLRRTACL